MNKIAQISWMSPEKRKKTYSTVPSITITFKDFKSGPQMKTSPYWRVTANKSFMQKYYPTDPKIKKISVYVGGQGVLIDPKPGKEQPFFVFGKTNYFTEKALAFAIMKHFNIPIKKAPEITSITLNVKPFGTFDDKPIYELVYINDENPDTTQLEGIKSKLESDENFPEADKRKGQKITVEG